MVAVAPCTLIVEDNGSGLDPADLPRAFERFYLYGRYGRDRPIGTGLGLAIVKELAEAMGGSVAVQSEVGAGTTFTVSLPRAPGPSEGDTAGSQAEPRFATAEERVR